MLAMAEPIPLRADVARRRARSRRSVRRITIIGVTLGTVAIANFLVYAIEKVAGGQGLDLYISGSGAKTSYLATVVLFALVPLLLGGAWVWSRWSKDD
jgi:hypothetical protein